MGNSVGYFCGWIYHFHHNCIRFGIFPRNNPEDYISSCLGIIHCRIYSGYVLNKGIDQIGVTAEGYIPDADRVIKNAVFGELQLQLHLSSHLFAKRNGVR